MYHYFDFSKAVFVLFTTFQKSACGYVILIVAVFWLTEALPIAVSALLPVFLFPMVGLLPVKEASQQYINVSIAPELWPASVAQLDAPSDWRPGDRGFNPRRGRQHSFVKIDHEIFSTVILSLSLIHEGQLSVSGERMCTILVNRLED